MNNHNPKTSKKSRPAPKATRQFNMGSTRPQKREVEYLRAAPKASIRRRLKQVMLLCTVPLIGFIIYMDGTSRVTVIDNASAESSLLANSAQYGETAEQVIARSVLHRTKLTVSTSDVEAQLLANHPELLRADVRTTLVSPSLIVDVELRQPQFILTVSGGGSQRTGRYLIDADGYAVATYTDELREQVQDEQYLTIDDQVTTEVVLGERVFSADTVWFIKELLRQLGDKDIQVERIVFPVAANDIHVFPAGEDYYVKYDISSNIQRQAGAHIATLGDSNTVSPDEYIDVRVSGRVFIK